MKCIDILVVTVVWRRKGRKGRRKKRKVLIQSIRTDSFTVTLVAEKKRGGDRNSVG